MDFKSSYNYLSLETREKIPQDNWKDFLFEQSTKKHSVPASVVIEPAGQRAKVMYKESPEKYFMLWGLENGNWYRKFYEQQKDNPAFLDEKVMSSEKAKKESILLEAKLMDQEIDKKSIIINEVYAEWYPEKSSAGIISFHPRIRFNVYNGGTSPMTRLSLLAVFFDGTSKEIFGKYEENLIRSNDLPLKPGYTSETCFMQSSIGLKLKEDMINVVKAKLLRIELYYKIGDMDKWELFNIYYNI